VKAAVPVLQPFYDGWENYQRLLIEALRPLMPRQMALRPAPGQWAVWQIASHMAGARMYWFHDVLGEGDSALRDRFRVAQTTVPGLPVEMAGWEDDENHPRASDEVVAALENTWEAVASCLERWSEAGLAAPFTRDRSHSPQTGRRDWVVWHLIEHDLHHGGEISSILGSNGLAVPNL
jgi:uncharacterized damage-inducible protein DinB